MAVQQFVATQVEALQAIWLRTDLSQILVPQDVAVSTIRKTENSQTIIRLTEIEFQEPSTPVMTEGCQRTTLQHEISTGRVFNKHLLIELPDPTISYKFSAIILSN